MLCTPLVVSHVVQSEEVKEEFEPEEVKLVDFDKEKELEELPELPDIEMEKAPSSPQVESLAYITIPA
eukprot:Skav215848  [mRNA]  locus=scaffold1630:158415:158618:- [translate_table: standard]